MHGLLEGGDSVDILHPALDTKYLQIFSRTLNPSKLLQSEHTASIKAYCTQIDYDNSFNFKTNGGDKKLKNVI